MPGRIVRRQHVQRHGCGVSSIAGASATLRITRPAPAAMYRGTIVLTTGAAGTNLADSFMTAGMVETFAADGLVVRFAIAEIPRDIGHPRVCRGYIRMADQSL